MKKLLVLSALLLLASAKAGYAANWLVERVSGAAWAVAQGREQIRLQPRMVVAEGVTIATGASGRVRLVSDGNAMMVSPNTRTVVVPGARPRETFVVQQAGHIEFDIQKRARPHFTLQTPYLAAVVKGTRFTVSVTASASTIDVKQGLVSVRDIRSGQTSDIGPNQQARASANVAGLQTAGTVAPGVVQGTPTLPAVAPVGRDHESFRSDRAPDQASPSGEAAGAGSGVANGGSGEAGQSRGLGGLGGRSDGGSGGNAFGRDGDEAAARGDGGRGDVEGNSRGGRGTMGGGNAGRGDADGSGNAGGGNGNGNNGNGNGNGGANAAGNAGGNADAGGGNGNGNNGNGNGNGGASGNANNAGGNGNAGGGNGNNGNGNGNGGATGNASNAGGNGNGGGGNGNNGNGGGNSSNAGGNGKGGDDGDDD